VIGAGSWGTTFGKILADGGATSRCGRGGPELANEINEAKRNSEYLPGINLPREMHATHHLSEALEGAEQVYLSIPSQAVRQNLKGVRPLVADTDAPIVSLMKGVERRTGLRMSQVIEQELHCDPSRIAVASGTQPRARDRARAATAAVISSTSQETAEAVARRARNSYFRTFVNTDVIGTEFGGVLKNLIAVGDRNRRRSRATARTRRRRSSRAGSWR
jgi:glycerol-3-phosphate dehydrogenase (NAD(P)+)